MNEKELSEEARDILVSEAEIAVSLLKEVLEQQGFLPFVRADIVRACSSWMRRQRELGKRYLNSDLWAARGVLVTGLIVVWNESSYSLEIFPEGFYFEDPLLETRDVVWRGSLDTSLPSYRD